MPRIEFKTKRTALTYNDTRYDRQTTPDLEIERRRLWNALHPTCSRS